MKIVKILTALLFSAIMGGVFALGATVIGLNPAVAGIAGAGLSMVPTKNGVLGIKIGTLTTGVGVITFFDLPYVPQYLKYTAGTQLTGLKVEVNGVGVTVDLDATGLNNVGKHRIQSIGTNMYRIPIADGMIKDRTCKITFTNSAAQTPDIVASGDNEGNLLIKHEKASVLANVSTSFQKFAALFLPGLAAADTVNTVYEDGLSQIDNREDLEGYSIMLQYTAGYLLDNLEGKIKSTTVSSGTTHTAYVTKVIPATVQAIV